MMQFGLMCVGGFGRGLVGSTPRAQYCQSLGLCVQQADTVHISSQRIGLPRAHVPRYVRDM